MFPSSKPQITAHPHTLAAESLFLNSRTAWFLSRGVYTGVEWNTLPHMDHPQSTQTNKPGSLQNTVVALIFPFLCAEGEGDVPPSVDVNTHLGCGVMHPAFSFAYCDEDSHLPGKQPKKQSTGCPLKGESAEQAHPSQRHGELTGP